MKALTCIVSLFLLTFGVLVAQSPASAGSVSSGILIVNVKGLRSQQGQVLLAIFADKDGFPLKAEKARFQSITPIVPGTPVVITLPKLPFGQYAVCLIHDEDADGKLKTGFFGIPSEGIGASRDAKGNFGPPSFDDAKFVIDRAELSISITMQYL